MTPLPPDIDERLDRITKEIDAVLSDPETLKSAEEFHRLVSRIYPRDILETFTI